MERFFGFASTSRDGASGHTIGVAMRRRAHYALLWVSLLNAQDVPDATLAGIQVKVAEHVLHLPDFVCAQTVERFERASAREEFRPLDTLRLEVALIGGRERYGWADSRQFDD